MTAAPIIRIVDDDPNIHDALAYVLENEGFIVRHYESAESFLINDRPEDPGCAILDVRMGEMSGIVLHDRMKKLGSKLPCIFLSAHGDVDMAVDAIPPLSSRPSSRWCLKQERPLNKYLGFVPKAETNFHKFELPRNSAVDNKFLFIWVC